MYQLPIFKKQISSSSKIIIKLCCPGKSILINRSFHFSSKLTTFLIDNHNNNNNNKNDNINNENSKIDRNLSKFDGIVLGMFKDGTLSQTIGSSKLPEKFQQI